MVSKMDDLRGRVVCVMLSGCVSMVIMVRGMCLILKYEFLEDPVVVGLQVRQFSHGQEKFN
jgi:hypothetical protein